MHFSLSKFVYEVAKLLLSAPAPNVPQSVELLTDEMCDALLVPMLLGYNRFELEQLILSIGGVALKAYKDGSASGAGYNAQYNRILTMWRIVHYIDAAVAAGLDIVAYVSRRAVGAKRDGNVISLHAAIWPGCPASAGEALPAAGEAE